MPKKKNTPRPDGLIRVRVYLGVVDGKPKYKYVYGKTQKEADAKALEVKISLGKGLDISAQRDTFAEWADRFLLIKSGSVSAGRMVALKSHIKYLNNHLGNHPIVKIRTADIQEIISRLAEQNPHTGKPSSRELLKAIKGTASQIFQLAIDNRIFDYNPVPAVVLPAKEHRSSRRALTPEEQKWITDTPHRAQTAAMIMMYAGLRRGELIPLTWSDIDLTSATISVNKAVEFVDGRARQKDFGKTPAATRIIDIPQRLVEYLRQQAKNSLLVCPSAAGTIHTKSSWQGMWRSYLKDLNIKYGDFTFYGNVYKSKYHPSGIPMVIPPITPHWLRHTYATLLYFAGVDILTAKAQLGHADIKTTLEIYTHLDRQYKRKAIDKLDKFLNEGNIGAVENE